MADLDDWTGLIIGRNDDFSELSVTALLTVGGNSFASPFLVAASDRRRYWVKCLGNCRKNFEMSVVIEYVVSAAGRLIDAPVCQSSLIRIPEELAGWPLSHGKLEAGLAHASLALPKAIERRPQLESRAHDDNARRQAGIYALWDWCFGDDPQWLYDLDNDESVYSHDHGLYLPANDGHWRRDYLIQSADEPNELPDPPHGLSREAVEKVSEALERINRDALVKILRGVPASWPVGDDDLEALGWFLEHRAPAVAKRTRALIEREV